MDADGINVTVCAWTGAGAVDAGAIAAGMDAAEAEASGTADGLGTTDARVA